MPSAEGRYDVDVTRNGFSQWIFVKVNRDPFIKMMEDDFSDCHRIFAGHKKYSMVETTVSNAPWSIAILVYWSVQDFNKI